MGKFIDLSGKRFGFLTVLERAPKGRTSNTVWICRCDCGSEVRAQSFDLRDAGNKSCGCRKGELVAAKVSTHGHWAGGKPSPEWRSWRSAVTRCHNPTASGFDKYGGAGIQVCAKWREDFAAFAADMGPRPEGATLDRIDNAIGYQPGNCRWATPKQQSQNLRRNRHVLTSGRRLTIREASDEFGLDYARFRRALYAHGFCRTEAGRLFSLLPR